MDTMGMCEESEEAPSLFWWICLVLLFWLTLWLLSGCGGFFCLDFPWNLAASPCGGGGCLLLCRSQPGKLLLDMFRRPEFGGVEVEEDLTRESAV